MRDYLVTLHDTQKRPKTRTVRCCVSKDAAARVADYLERVSNTYSRSIFQSTYVKEVCL